MAKKKTWKPRPRDPEAGNNAIAARVSDSTKDEILGIVEKTGLSISQVARKAIEAGLPEVKENLAKKPG